ncbi:MAG: polysaccharide biosynthesis protein [Eubacteriales bacterium]
MGNQKKSTGFVLQGIILASASIIVRLIGLVYRIPLTNILGDKGIALYGYAFEVYNIALLLSSYSLPLAVSKLVSARVVKGERRNAYRVFKLAFLLATVVGFVVALIVFFGADFIAGTIMKADESAYALRVLAPCLFIVAILGVMRGYCQGLGTTIPTAISQILEQIVNAIISIVAAYYLVQLGAEAALTSNNDMLSYAYGAAGGTLGTVTGALAALFFMLFVFYSYRPIINKQMKREQNTTEEAYRNIFKILIMTVVPVIFSTAIYNINGILDQSIYNNVMLAQGYTEDEYYVLWGMYSGKYKVLMNVPLGVSNAFAASVIPSLTAAAVARNRKEMHAKIALAIRMSMLIAIPSCVAFLIFAKPILDLLFSGDNTTASYILMMGSLSVALFCLSTITNGILQGINRMSLPIKNAAKSLVIHLVFLILFLFVFKWHIYAVVLSSTIFALSMSILNAKAIRIHAKYHQEIEKTFLLPLASAAIMGAVSYAVYYGLQYIVSANLSIIASMIIAIITYGIALIKTGALPEDDIYDLPKGAALVRLLNKLHLL